MKKCVRFLLFDLLDSHCLSVYDVLNDILSAMYDMMLLVWFGRVAACAVRVCTSLGWFVY